MRNILHIIESLEFGGAEKVVLQLANGLSSKYNISICITKREGDLIKDVNKNISIYPLNSKEGNDLSIIPSIAKIIKENKIDVVHIHNWGVFIESVLASKYAGVNRIVHTVHGPYISYEVGVANNLKKHFRHFIEYILSFFVYKFISVSNAIKSYMIDDIGINKNRIKTIHNGIKGLLKKERSINNLNSINLVCVGRVAKIKNHRLLLSALKEACETVDVCLTIVGDGPEFDEIISYSNELKINDKIDFMGFRTDIDDILKNMDICIVTSDYEGISIAILEAMSLGMPVIASNVGGNPETVIDNKTGILFGKGDKNDLVKAIIRMASNKSLRESMGNAAFTHFQKNFHEDNVLNQYSLLYSD